MTSASPTLGSEDFNLEIGGGGLPSNPSWIQLDIRLFSGISILADARKLPIKKDSLGRVCASHVIEHMSYADGVDFLQDCFRCLKVGGTIQISCPDISRIIEAYRHTRNLEHLIGGLDMIKSALYGAQSHSYDFHLAGYDFPLLRKALESIGFTGVTPQFEDEGTLPKRLKAARGIYEFRVQASKDVRTQSKFQTAESRPDYTEQEYWRKELDARDKAINEIQKELDTREMMIREVQKELDARDKAINEIQKQLLAKDEMIGQLRMDLAARDGRISELRLDLEKNKMMADEAARCEARLRLELEQIHNSLTWQLLRRLQRIEARLFPVDSKRGKMFLALIERLRLRMLEDSK